MWGVALLVGGLLTLAFLYRSQESLTSIPVKLSEKDNGIRIAVKPGSSIELGLTVSPGYGWFAATEVYPLGRPTIQTVPGRPSLPVTWYEIQTYKITSGMIGSHRVQLEYRRPSDPPSVTPAKIFRFDTIVTP